MPTLVETVYKAGHSAWIEVRLDRLRANFQALKEFAGPDTAIMAVVKANAYGHGLVEISRALAGHASYLGVSSLFEALELKEHGIETPIFLFGRLWGAEAVTALKNRLTLSLSSFEEASEISEAALGLGIQARVHIKVDTGMGRLGIPAAQALAEIEKIAALGGLLLDGLYTHFPTAEKEDGFCQEQTALFLKIAGGLEAKAIRFRLCHAANSAGTFKIKHPRLNMVRPGLILYGIDPDPGFKKSGCFAPVLSLKSRIILVKRMMPGESVGYGRSYRIEKPSYIATIPVGYSHGYPVALSSKSWVLYKGRRYPVAGRVSMDYLSVDLGAREAKAGDEVTLLGEDQGEEIRARDLADWAGTIPYEIITRLSSRLPRIYRA